MSKKFAVVLVGMMSVLAVHAQADDMQQIPLHIKDHAFVPAEVKVPADKKFKLVITNDDDNAAEFESSELNREKVVAGHGEITVFIGPLSAGAYGFYDDFHRDTTGKLVAQP
ncbi:MAG: cupredoxin domain-containing protein [Alphaproteobacteria bacterium]|nr:cupredoxin domain-containing protein [Alphaproteobacteria bacterium]